MDYRRLGHGGLQVSVIGLGTNNFGPRLDYPAAERVVRQAVEVGINFIATSNTYGEGQAEAFIGKAVHGCRAQVLLATKVASNMGDGPNMHGGSRKHILEQVERSLQRLQTDYLDLYQIHFYHIPPDLVVECGTAHRKPPDVRICRLRNQSRVGTFPPSTST